MKWGRAVLLILLVLGVLLVPLVADAQQPAKTPRIGFLAAVSLVALSDRVEAFRQGLRELGYVEGQTITIEYRSAEGKYDRLPALAAELVRKQVDVIVTAGPPAPDAALKATRTIPIVVAVGADSLVGSDGIASYARPGGNVTGLTSSARDLTGKQLALLREVVPRLSRVAVLRDPAHPGHAPAVQQAREAARTLGLQLVVIDVQSPAALDGAFRHMAAETVEGALVLRGGLFVRLRESLTGRAVQAAMPTMFGFPEDAEAGGLISYGTDGVDLYRRAATYVHRILRGAKPADLPVEQPTKFELVINLKTAKALGLTIPPSLLLRADQVIE
jgi:putative ABC transport system substrate-binding protein